MRSGVIIWVERERAQSFQRLIEAFPAGAHRFIGFEDETLNTADIEGIYKASTVDELTRRKNGEWQCQGGKWHQKGEKCECPDKETADRINRRAEAIKNCGKCQAGWIQTKNGVAPCECVKNL